MNGTDILTRDCVVAGIDFEEGFVLIRFLEKEKQLPRVQISETMYLAIDSPELAALVDRIQDYCLELLDEGHLIRRNPPKQFSSIRERMIAENMEEDLSE